MSRLVVDENGHEVIVMWPDEYKALCDERDAARQILVCERSPEWADQVIAFELASARADNAESENKRLKDELNRRKGDPITRLHNLCEGLEEPLACGHDLSEWCDRCETCGVCEDEKTTLKKTKITNGPRSPKVSG